MGSDSLLSESVLDYLDWLEAERECYRTACIGSPPYEAT